MVIKKMEDILEKKTGLTLDQVDRMSLDEIEECREKKSGVKLEYPESLSPYEVGGSIFYIGKIQSPEKIKRELEKLIRKYF